MGFRLLLQMLTGGLLACVGPLTFDVCASIYAGRIHRYAPPFFYPIFLSRGQENVKSDEAVCIYGGVGRYAHCDLFYCSTCRRLLL